MKLNPLIDGSNRLRLQNFLGQILTCEDGEKRRVFTVLPSSDFAYFLINSGSGSEGHRVHLLSATREISGNPRPSLDEIRKFNEIAKSFEIEWKGHQDPGAFEWQSQKKKQKKRHQ